MSSCMFLKTRTQIYTTYHFNNKRLEILTRSNRQARCLLEGIFIYESKAKTTKRENYAVQLKQKSEYNSDCNDVQRSKHRSSIQDDKHQRNICRISILNVITENKS